MSFIEEEEIEKKTISSKPINILGKYDMYYIFFKMKTGETKRVRVFCEKGTFPDFNSNEFEKLKQKHGEQLLSNFFVKRLIGKEGLMKKSGREDFIYLGGELYKDGYIANRFIIQPNGKTGQKDFDDNLFRILLQVNAIENQNSMTRNENKGKTYVVSDIHGMYGSYIEVMKRMSSKDHIIILGDVIDRGTGGIQIIQDIIKRKQNNYNNPQITFMLGNHEMKFIQTVASMIRNGLHKEDLHTIMNRRNAFAQFRYYSMFNTPELIKEQEKYKKLLGKFDVGYQKLIKDNNLTESELDIIGGWLNVDRGNTTIFDFLIGGRVKGVLEQDTIYKFLLDSYVVLHKKIKGKDYLFVHSTPPKDPQMIRKMKSDKIGYKIRDLEPDQYGFMLSARDEKTPYEQTKACGFTTICGHTPEFGTIVKDENKGFIRIDAGCGHRHRDSKLALYCIDDGSVQYFDEKEAAQEQISL